MIMQMMGTYEKCMCWNAWTLMHAKFILPMHNLEVAPVGLEGLFIYFFQPPHARR